MIRPTQRGGGARRRVAGLAAAALTASMLPLGVGTLANAAPPSGTACVADPEARLGSVPSPEQFLGFPLGTGQSRPVTNDEIVDYLQAVDSSSDRVVTGVMTTSVDGRSLPYAIVSSSANMVPGQVQKVAHQIAELRDPRSLKPDKAARYAADVPAIVWIAGNVHGGEKSGADGALRTLYELASGESCDVQKRLDNLVTVILPTQNPDGREASRRQNEFGFDLNRDWFARTQRESDAKLEMLRAYPPQVFIDAHEMGSKRFFFPPNADPIHHEIADQPVDWINRIGAANAEAFDEHFNGACRPGVTEECYFNYQSYDLFFMGYGDTVPATGFGAAGMTYEKGSASTVADRVQQQFMTQWATTGWAADNKQEVLKGYYQIYETALAEGRAGILEPNEVVQPTNTVQFPVPDITVRSYFLLPDRQLGDVRALVDRLRRMDVEVYRLKEPVTVPDARIFGGRSATNRVVPAGSYWIPMDQPQKHWIQALIGEDPYVPFPYFYDVSSWSNPLLMGVETIYTGDELAPAADLVKGVDGGVAASAPAGGSYSYPMDSAAASELTFALLRHGVALKRDVTTGDVSFSARGPVSVVDKLARSYGVSLAGSRTPASGVELRLPDVGLYAGPGISVTAGSHGEARYVLGERWGLDLTPVTQADINGNTDAFRNRSVLVVPDGSNATGGLTAIGQANLKAWVAAGGTYVGLRNEGTRMARAAGLTSTTERAKPTGYQVIGSHFRVDVDTASPVALGRPSEDFEFNNSDSILGPSTTGTNVLTYPSGDSFWRNGYTVREDALKGTVALVDEPTGAGHAVLFAYNPLFRAYNENGIHLVANALLYPSESGATATERSEARTPRAQSAGDVEARRAAAAATSNQPDLGGLWRPITIAVAPSDLGRAEAVVAGYTGTARTSVADGTAYIVIPNPDGLYADEHPFLRDLVHDLSVAKIALRSVTG